MQDPPRAGRLILLNGASSAGKTAIAEHLQVVLPTPWFHVGIDAVNAMRGQARTRDLNQPALDIVLARTRAGHCRAVAGLVDAGNDVIADCVLWQPGWLGTWLDVMVGRDVLFVGVRCPVDELERREVARDDRAVGKAAAQSRSVHAHGVYDVEVDTSEADPRACADRVASALGRPAPRAFDRLRLSATR